MEDVADHVPTKNRNKWCRYETERNKPQHAGAVSALTKKAIARLLTIAYIFSKKSLKIRINV